MGRFRVAALSAVVAAVMLGSPSVAAPGAEVVYRNAHIVTVDDRRPAAQAVAIRAGRIVGVGDDRAVLARWGRGARVVDLHGRTMVPGFVDGHSHIGDLVATWRAPDLSSPPVGTTRTLADVQRIMTAAVAAGAVAPGALVMGVGFDDSLVAERRYPNLAEMDAISARLPVCVVHVSGHLARCNSAALASFGYTRDTPDPKGGHLGRDASGALNGGLEEFALGPMMNAAPRPSLAEAAVIFEEVQAFYLSQGYTTAQDGITSNPVSIQLLLDGQRANTLKLDIASYPRWTLIDQLVAERGIKVGGPYANRLKFAGVKITADGSPQGKTAFLTQPYAHPPSGAGADYRGSPNIAANELADLYATYMGRGWQVQTHCNGDACIDNLIAAVRHAYALHPQARATRPVVIHSQVTRSDQLKAYAELGLFPSFFAEHTYYWGDWHRTETLGAERGRYISPTADALKAGVRFSLHTDAPVVPPVPMHAIWSAVNRVTRSGFALGPDQRLSLRDALRAVTIWPAVRFTAAARPRSRTGPSPRRSPL